MKKTASILFTLIFIPASIVAGPYDNIAKKLLDSKIDSNQAIAVIPFDFNGGSGVFVSEEITTSLINAGAKVVERNRINDIIKEHEIRRTGMITQENAIEIGKGLGANYIVTGTVSEIQKADWPNKGLRINARLVEVESFRVLATARAEICADDRRSAYRRSGPRKPAEYPSFLGFFAGINFIDYTVKYSGDRHDIDLNNPGLTAGFRYLRANSGFYTSGYEFSYTNPRVKDSGSDIHTLDLNRLMVFRLPLWRYADSLPYPANLYFGPSIGFTVSRHYYDQDGGKNRSHAIGFNIYAFLGMQHGITDDISLFTEYRYMHEALNKTAHTQDGKAHRNRYSGHSIMAGIYFSP